MRALAALTALPDQRATSLPIGLARIGVGLAALLGAVEAQAGLRRLHEPDLLKLPRFDFVSIVPEAAIGLLVGLWVLAGVAFCLGWRSRPAGTILVGLATYTLLLDFQLYSNHFYLLILLTLLLTLADSSAAVSIDARRRGRAASIPAWPVALIRVLVSIVYGFAVLAKLNPYFLSGLVLRTNMQIPGIDRLPGWIFLLLAVASLATEAFLGVAFWSRRLRFLAFVVGVAFHLTILATMRVLPDLLTFSLLMASAYLAFFSTFEARSPNEPTSGIAASGQGSLD
ncbi:MAG: HTTM domain-containing protein [Actinomycetota bacterium]